MPRKKDPDQNYGQKLIRLFTTLLFAGEPKSLIELSQQLNCSKQTVMKIVDDITQCYSVRIEDLYKGRRKYYLIRAPKTLKKAMRVTAEELAVLEMCRNFTKHLLGQKLFEEAANAIGKTWLSLSDGDKAGSSHFSDFIPGTIDYTPYYPIILTLIQTMEKRLICRIRYQRLMAETAKEFYIKPLKLFSHKDTLYLHARLARTPGQNYREPDFDPLLPVHRIASLDVTDRNYEFPTDYNFEAEYNQTFGIMNNESFQAEIEFSGWAAAYVQERTWSPDQKITKHPNGHINLKLTASSEQEVISWVMSFGPEAFVAKPKWLREVLKARVSAVSRRYV
jgi:predicted DNA-binding transcriptional regulator YafY